MRFARPCALAGLLLAVTVTGRGAEGSGATLDETKQELRQLQSDQKNKAGQNADKLKLGTPTFDLQLQDAGSPEAWLSDKLKQERKLKDEKVSKKNWLIDGVEKLEKENSQAKGATTALTKEGTTSEATSHGIDQSDPQYLLKLFDEQKKSPDNKSTASKSSSPAAPDAFAPFLQSWLGSSPVRGQFFDQFVKKPDGGAAGGASVTGPDYRGPSFSSDSGPAPLPEIAVMEKTNPYLAEMNAPILTKELMGDAAGPLPSTGAPLLAPEAIRGGPVATPLDPVPEARERAKAPLPGLADDKKYFPQLKRF